MFAHEVNCWPVLLYISLHVWRASDVQTSLIFVRIRQYSSALNLVFSADNASFNFNAKGIRAGSPDDQIYLCQCFYTVIIVFNWTITSIRLIFFWEQAKFGFFFNCSLCRCCPILLIDCLFPLIYFTILLWSIAWPCASSYRS